MYQIILRNPCTGRHEAYTIDCHNRIGLDIALEVYKSAGFRVAFIEDLSIWESLTGEQEKM